MDFSKGPLSRALAAKYTEIPRDDMLMYINFCYIDGLCSHILHQCVPGKRSLSTNISK